MASFTSAAYDPHSRIGGAHVHGYRVGTAGELTDATTWTLGLGPGGGIVMMMGGTITVTGSVASNGVAGADGNQGACGGVRRRDYGRDYPDLLERAFEQPVEVRRDDHADEAVAH